MTGKVLPVVVPARPGEPPMLTLHLTIEETVNIIYRHLSRIAVSGDLLVEFRTSRLKGRKGLVTTIHAEEDL